MIEMIVDSIRVSLMNYQRVVILKEKTGERYLPIWVGPSEADAIAVKLQGVSVPRPLTHDYLCTMINALGATITSVIINQLIDETFYSMTTLEMVGKQIEIDCRPSDSIAMAIRTGAPIFADEDVLKKAGILLDPVTGKPISSEKILPKNINAFSNQVKEIFTFSQTEAGKMKSNYIGTEYLLLGLIMQTNNAAIILKNLNVNINEIKSLIKIYANLEQPSDDSKMALTLNAKKAIEIAIEEAKSMSRPEILPEHLLLGLVKEENGLAPKVLKSVGITPERIYKELLRIHNHNFQ